MWLVFAASILSVGFAFAGQGGVVKTTSAAGGLFRWRPFLGPFHSLVLHYPIGFLTMAFILELYRMRRPSEELRGLTTLVIGLSLASGLVAATLGLMRAGGGDYNGQNLDMHRLFGMSVPFLTLFTLFLHVRGGRAGSARAWLHGYRATLVCALTALVVAGHYGGNLTHGSKYLVQNAPDFVKELLEPHAVAGPPSEEVRDAREQFFLDKVQPILEAKCIRCHGPEKQKGQYRLDRADIAAKGGESGKIAIKPEDPMESNLVRLIMLPREDDEAMPPEGKEPLTGEEVMTVVRWIQEGAAFAFRPALSDAGPHDLPN
jgi:uncharacterized membrane protein